MKGEKNNVANKRVREDKRVALKGRVKKGQTEPVLKKNKQKQID